MTSNGVMFNDKAKVKSENQCSEFIIFKELSEKRYHYTTFQLSFSEAVFSQFGHLSVPINRIALSMTTAQHQHVLPPGHMKPAIASF